MVQVTYLQGSNREADIGNSLCTQWGKEGEGRTERVTLKPIHYHRENKLPVGISVWCGEFRPGTLLQPGGLRWEVGGKFKEKTYGYLRLIYVDVWHKWASHVAQLVKHLPAMQETWFNSWVRKLPWRRKWQPTPVFLPGESHGRRGLVGYGSWNRSSWTRLSALFVA